MTNNNIRRIRTLSEYHRTRSLPAPEHPLISLIDYRLIRHTREFNDIAWVYDFYMIAMKKGLDAKLKYGQLQYDFDEGTMFFIAPGQVFQIEVVQDAPGKSGWMLLIHPDFFRNRPLAQDIKKYKYFGYSVREALFLSEKEEAVLTGIVQNIRQEYQGNIDKFSQQIIISQIEALLNYAERFYQRQFLTREVANHQVLEKLETLLDEYFEHTHKEGLPTVNYLAGQLNLTPDYLSSLLKVATGLNTQQHIHEKLIEKAKDKLIGTTLTVSEIAYELGFEHSQSFSKLFKAKTNLSPLAFRQSLK
ncbi:helix-turn-helix transcriptional regulator [Chitinophaga oryzae]|uniref:Helix-turn-helix transcriptional regulator n=1 Tax=Chitinophaga oryzae TaxID=2725414 RepID=A0AAE7D788_9BACT|nr:response regulator transcription factor [Chitinophaga oryzae]QJB30781.1 helix-turn-helix transcriptional regulator [Chitinophaga oryzae]QJB37283.1 helix-turn-helix transcriptional regulator [Chitinophaga oryzae]